MWPYWGYVDVGETYAAPTRTHEVPQAEDDSEPMESSPHNLDLCGMCQAVVVAIRAFSGCGSRTECDCPYGKLRYDSIGHPLRGLRQAGDPL